MTHCQPALVLICVLTVFAPRAHADEVRLDARDLFTRGVVQDVELAADEASVVLTRGVLIEDDGPAAGYSYQPQEEPLGAKVRLRKTLVVPRPQAARATLLWAPNAEVRCELNGREVALTPAGPAGRYWMSATLPVDSLRSGENAFVLSGKGKLWIARDADFAAGSRERTRHPNRSAKSADEGRTWDDQRLGANGALDGEYCVRLFLDQYQAAGKLTTDAIDLGQLSAERGTPQTALPIAPPVEAIEQVRITLERDSGAGRMTLRYRTGAQPAPAAPGWSLWQKAPADGRVAAVHGRYLQLEATLATDDPLASPKLAAITVAATVRRPQNWAAQATVTGHNERVVRTSIPFRYEPFDQPRLKQLRESRGLDEVVGDARTDLEIATRLAAWTARQWEKGHLAESYPPWDALAILQPHADGRPVGGFCQQYNLVLLQACESFGLVGRCVSLGAGDHGAKFGSGHEVVEIWLNEHRKWAYIDGNEAWYFVDAVTRTPLSLRELRERQLQHLQATAAGNTPPRSVEIVRIVPTAKVWNSLADFPPFVELRLIPRSNFLEERSPLPLHQGMRGWFWTGHYAWTDARSPASLLYGQRISQPQNWDWTINQAQLTLEATAAPGEVVVHLDTETPGFDAFVAQFDDGPQRTITSGERWQLRPGANRLRVQVRNRAGRTGPASSVVIAHQGR
jgi:hypothetical protein